ncbi:hypothetical protein JZ751_023861 [Albula glossodonta]|uniref:LIM zinc-binding domain-containing protein n=1 Tax=Albula glossodonta TaxID=121402 RepID=A0A8T2NHV9_9TELE|nr:hypothetical protein JZ751_023861 [Albula glossodonta]
MFLVGNDSGGPHKTSPASSKTDPTVTPVDKTDEAPAKLGSKPAAPSSGPACRPPWVTDPGFADRYRPDKTSTVLTQHSQPAQPTPMQNRSSILQAAQQGAPDSTRTPVGGFFEERGSVFCTKCYDCRYAPNCAKCRRKITGEIMHALKMTYHVQCFTCAACKTPIRNQAFYMEEGEPYCERGEQPPKSTPPAPHSLDTPIFSQKKKT